MKINNNEKDIIAEYIKTIKRFNNLKIPKNNFLKLPYIENYLIKISYIENDYELIKKILINLNDDIISNEDLLFIINYYLDINKDEKNNIFKFLNNTEQNIIMKNNIEIIIFNIRYFRFYLILSELLFDLKEEDNELYFYLYLLNENDQKKIKFYSKKYFNFKIIYELYSILQENYNKIYSFLINNNLINRDINTNLLLFKNIFKGWFNIYLKDSDNELIENKINKFIIKKQNIFNRFICNNNL